MDKPNHPQSYKEQQLCCAQEDIQEVLICHDMMTEKIAKICCQGTEVNDSKNPVPKRMYQPSPAQQLN